MFVKLEFLSKAQALYNIIYMYVYMFFIFQKKYFLYIFTIIYMAIPYISLEQNN